MRKLVMLVAAGAAASYTNVCADFSSPFCTLHKSAQDVTILFAALSGPLAPGTYTMTQDATKPSVDPSTGLLYVAFGESLRTDASCTPTSGAEPVVATGTLRLDQVSGSTVTGHVDVTFSDGGKLQGDFSAPVCPGTPPDMCALAQSGGKCAMTPTCS